MRRLWFQLCLCWSLAASPAPARAAELAPDRATDGSKTPTFGDRALSPFTWEVGEPRFFVAWAVDLGLVYFRPRSSIGYGRPHHEWIGIDLNPIVSVEGMGLWAGLRFALPAVDLRVGARHQRTFRRALLEPRDDYDQLALEDTSGPESRYTSLEAELTWGVRGGPGVFFGEVAGTYVAGVKEGYYVFEETIDVVAKPPWIWRARGGYAVGVAFAGTLTLGPVVELVGVPGRDAISLRAGIVARLRLFYDFEVRGNFIPLLAGPDELGLGGGDAFEIGLRWRWATGGTSDD